MVNADSLWTPFTAENSPLTSNFISSLNFDNDGNQYICTSGGGLVVRNDSSWAIFDESNTGALINAVRVAARDNNNNLWLGAATGNLDISPQGFGIARMDAADSMWSMENGGLEVSQIVTGIIVNETNRYVSTYGGGVTIYSESGWIRYRVASRAEFSYADSQLQIFNVPPGTYLPSDHIRALDYDHVSGVIWLGTANGGVVRLTGNDWVTYNVGNSGLPCNQILSVKVDQATGNACFGTAGMGAAIYDGLNWTLYNQSNSPMVNAFITAIEVDPINGDIWLGTSFNILVHEPDGDWRIYSPNQNNLVWGNFYSDISFDPSGNVWVAAYNGGMAVLLQNHVPPPPPPPPPSPDSLYFTFEKLNITFVKNQPIEKITTIFNVSNAPDLAPEDTISFGLESGLGELYYIEAEFGDFRHMGSEQVPINRYRYKFGQKTIVLKFSTDDRTIVNVKIIDRDAGMNRENYSDQLVATFKMGESVGSSAVQLVNGELIYIHPQNPGPDNVQKPDQIFYLGDNIDLGQNYTAINQGPTLSNYPNPFNGQTMIRLDMVNGGEAHITVYDILGRQVSDLFNGYLDSGIHQFAWPENGTSSEYKTGVYYYRVFTGKNVGTGKMIYMK
jgi:hypothetical protein